MCIIFPSLTRLNIPCIFKTIFRFQFSASECPLSPLPNWKGLSPHHTRKTLASCSPSGLMVNMMGDSLVNNMVNELATEATRGRATRRRLVVSDQHHCHPIFLFCLEEVIYCGIVEGLMTDVVIHRESR